MTKYYGLAIRRNSESLAAMKNEITATYLHMSSTNEKTSLENFPTGTDS